MPTRCDGLLRLDRRNSSFAKSRAELLALGKKPKREQAEMLEMARLMTPDGVTPLHANSAADGKTVTIVAVASSWTALVAIVMRPAAAMASREFTTRLISTCSS